MDLQNLVTVEYSVSYNQSKLQNVIKQLQNKFLSFSSSIFNIQTKCKLIEQSENNVLSRILKFQQFTVDNFRQTHSEVSILKSGLRNFLGDEWIKEQSKIQVVPKKTHFDQIFQNKLSAFNSQAKQLSKKVSELKVQLTTKTSHHQEQAEEVKQTILQQKNQIKKIRESIREGINEQFSHYKKQFQEKNLKDIYKKVQLASEASLKSLEQMEGKNVQAIEKAMKQYKRVSITNNMPSSADLPIGKPETLNHLESCGKLFMGGQDQNGLQDVVDFQSDIRNRKKAFWGDNQHGESQQNNEIQQTKISTGQGFQKNVQMPNSNQNQPSNHSAHQNIIEIKSMTHAINQLREELINMIKSETMEFKSSIQSFTERSEKLDVSLTTLFKDSTDMKKDFKQSFSTLQDMRNEIENLKNSLYENNQKQGQSISQVIEVESKVNSIQAELKSLSNDVQALSTQEQKGDQSSRFRDIKNLSRVHIPSERNSVQRNSLNKNSGSSSNLNNENVIVSRLNLLTEKMSKVEEKLKNSSFNSDKNLPRIGSSTNITTKTNNNSPSFDLLKKDLQNTNEELNKTNERLITLKKHLKQLQVAHNLIPNRISKLQTQVTQINQIQQDRLLQLIKELINRVLTDPFNNNFTNTLKRQIHVKFLQIKHEYSSIWKEIETKVTDRAQTAELEKLKENIQTQNIQIKTLINKKADNDDFKKGIKYIDTKLKQVYTYLKGKQDLENTSQGRKYYMGKKP